MNSLSVELIIFLSSIVTLLLLVAVLLKFSVKLGRLFGVGDFSMSFILMAFATSIPELLIAFVASTKDLGDIGLGIVIGSSVINLTLITGLITLFSKGLDAKNIYKRRQALLLGFMVSFNIFTILDGQLTRFDGMILILAYFIYLYELWFCQAREKEKHTHIHYSEFMTISAILIFTVCSILFLADVVTESTYNLSNKIGVSQFVISLLMLSTVTALPELIFEFKNLRENKERMSLGDLMGAVGTNASLVIGLIAIVNPLTITIDTFLLVVLFFYAMSVILFLSFLYTRNQLDWREGVVLVAVYICFLLCLFMGALASI